MAGNIDWIWSNAPDYFGYMNINTSTWENGYALYGILREGGYVGPYPAQAALLSPQFDFSGVEDVIELSFDYTAGSYDITTTLRVQASTDNFQNEIIDL